MQVKTHGRWPCRADPLHLLLLNQRPAPSLFAVRHFLPTLSLPNPCFRKSQGKFVKVSVDVKHWLVRSGAQHGKWDKQVPGGPVRPMFSVTCVTYSCAVTYTMYMLMKLPILIKHRCWNTSRNAFLVTPLFRWVFWKGEVQNVAPFWRKGLSLAFNFGRNKRGESLLWALQAGSGSAAMGHDLLVNLYSVFF